MRSLILALVVACSGCTPRFVAPPPLTGSGLGADGKPLELELARYESNDRWKLSQERGHVVLLDVWASWCEPCRDSLPLYDDMQKEYGARGLRVYALNIDADPVHIKKFLQTTKISVPVLLDPNAAIAEKVLKVNVMPTTFLIDRKGVVRATHEGFAEELLVKYLAEVDELLKEPAPK